MFIVVNFLVMFTKFCWYSFGHLNLLMWVFLQLKIHKTKCDFLYISTFYSFLILLKEKCWMILTNNRTLIAQFFVYCNKWNIRCHFLQKYLYIFGGLMKRSWSTFIKVHLFHTYFRLFVSTHHWQWVDPRGKEPQTPKSSEFQRVFECMV